jgi:hypothetical protein
MCEDAMNSPQKPHRVLKCLARVGVYLSLWLALVFLFNSLHLMLNAVWRSLGPVPEQPTSILGLGRSLDPSAVDIFVRTAGDTIYHCCASGPTAWIAEAPQDQRDEVLPSPCNLPLAKYYPTFPSPPGHMIACAQSGPVEYVAHNTIYALLDSGEVWRLEYYQGVDTLLAIAAAGGLLAFAILWGASRLLARFRRRRSNV